VQDHSILRLRDSALHRSVDVLLSKILVGFPERLDVPVRAYIAGGTAAYLYTGQRMSSDLDIEFSRKVLVPADLLVEYVDDDGQRRALEFDHNYNSSFALMHEQYTENALFLGCPNADGRLEVFVLSPLDLAISKIARFSDTDRLDIMSLAQNGLITADQLKDHAMQSLVNYIGSTTFVQCNIDEAVKIVRSIEPRPRVDHGMDHGSR